ncbi:MAG: CDP-alcohol phosphatidyltransferase family protein [Actinomycetes bacterium]
MRRILVPDRDTYLARWSVLHGGYDPRSSRFVSGWLGLAYVGARPLAARGLGPDAVTLAGVVVAAGVLGVTWAGGGWVAAAGGLAVVAGLVDSMDGAVAVLTGRDTRTGFVLDSMADRVGDVLFLAALWRLGAPVGLVVAGGLATFLQEYLRARAAAAGMDDVGVVTVAERPTRVIVTAVTLGAVGLAAMAGLPGHGVRLLASAGGVAWAVLGAVGLVQLAVVVRRRLR